MSSNHWFPANFIAETTATELKVLGREVDSPAANKTYYRVVAVDGTGGGARPSDYATAPRPVIYSQPVLAAKVGAGIAMLLSGIPDAGKVDVTITATIDREVRKLDEKVLPGNQAVGQLDFQANDRE